ncbi:hypothetical protein Aduo_015335 [Ancylostoma duodenale]
MTAFLLPCAPALSGKSGIDEIAVILTAPLLVVIRSLDDKTNRFSSVDLVIQCSVSPIVLDTSGYPVVLMLLSLESAQDHVVFVKEFWVFLAL